MALSWDEGSGKSPSRQHNLSWSLRRDVYVEKAPLHRIIQICSLRPLHATPVLTLGCTRVQEHLLSYRKATGGQAPWSRIWLRTVFLPSSPGASDTGQSLSITTAPHPAEPALGTSAGSSVKGEFSGDPKRLDCVVNV